MVGREIFALFGPVAMQCFHSLLHLLALVGGHVGVQQRWLIRKAIPVIGNDTTIAWISFKRSRFRTGLLPRAVRIFGSHIRFWIGIALALKAHFCEARFSWDLGSCYGVQIGRCFSS